MTPHHLRPEQPLVESRVQQLGLDTQPGKQGFRLVEAVQQGGRWGLAGAIMPTCWGKGRGGGSYATWWLFGGGGGTLGGKN